MFFLISSYRDFLEECLFLHPLRSSGLPLDTNLFLYPSPDQSGVHRFRSNLLLSTLFFRTLGLSRSPPPRMASESLFENDCILVSMKDTSVSCKEPFDFPALKSYLSIVQMLALQHNGVPFLGRSNQSKLDLLIRFNLIATTPVKPESDSPNTPPPTHPFTPFFFFFFLASLFLHVLVSVSSGPKFRTSFFLESCTFGLFFFTSVFLLSMVSPN